MAFSKNKWSCPCCNDKTNHEIVGTKYVDPSSAVYKCNSCKELFTTVSGCGCYCDSIVYRDKIIEKQHDKSTI